MRYAFTLFFFIAVTWSPAARAWDAHDVLTKLALQAYEDWPEVSFQPIEEVLSSLAVGDRKAPTSVRELSEQLRIRTEKVQWNWVPSQDANALDVLAFGSIEADHGMDQDLELGPDQAYMGGSKGPASQGVRHMYYRAWSILEPFVTFHVPFHEMGHAPERAELYFSLAKQAEKAGHLFWAYRFLGWGVHYVEDIGQPYHANQLGSLSLFPLWTLIVKGWEAGVAEATRLSGNFHLSFEQYVMFMTQPERESKLPAAFKAPNADEELKAELEQNSELSIEEGVKKIAAASSRLAPRIVAAQDRLMGARLRSPDMHIIPGFYRPDGSPKIDFAALESDSKLTSERKELVETAFEALSNTGVAIRWYVDRFRRAAE